MKFNFEPPKAHVRKTIRPDASLIEVVQIMSEGNPGAIRVMVEILRKLLAEKGIALILALDDMNIRGTQIWIGYKDHCHENVDEFIRIVSGSMQTRRPLINTINAEGLRGNHAEEAVLFGASDLVERSVLHHQQETPR